MATLDDLKVGTLAPLLFPIDRAITTSTKLEKLGYDSIWFPDHLMGWIPDSIWTPDITVLSSMQASPHTFPEVSTAIAAHASHTQTLQMGTAVTEVLRKHPAAVAQTFVTLDHISKGRVILGLGAGEAENLVPYGIPFDHPVSRLEESLRVIKLLWDPEKDPNAKINFDGKYVKLEDAVFSLPLYEDKAPPIWLGAHGPRMLNLTGELADGWLPANLPPADYKLRLKQIIEVAKKFGREESAVTPGLFIVTALAEDHEECHEMFKTPIARAWALVEGSWAFEAAGARHPLAERDDGKFYPFLDYIPNRYERDEILAALEKIPDGMMEGTNIHGTDEDVLKKLEEYVDAGLKHVVLWNLTGMMEPSKHFESIALMKKVVSYIKG
ncbi:MAG: LLM class flavin-dependent oxidoreductase [Candidatus Heimdallarchaeota archaeon]